MSRVSEPLFRTAPRWSNTLGGVAAQVGADLGLKPDAEQRWLLDAIYAETEDATPEAFEVCVVAPRQNIKSSTLAIAALTDLFVLGVDLAVWTAHEHKTARKSFEDMRRRIRRHPDYEARAGFETARGREAIFLDTGERLEFHARSGGSGRGFTCSKITLDEWLFGQPGDVGALVPTMFTEHAGQVRYGSSAGLVRSQALRDLRAKGRAGDSSLAYVEYGAPRRACKRDQCPHLPVGEVPGCALDDRDLWWRANCALWAGRATFSAVEKMRRTLAPKEFMREFLSWWEDPPNVEGGDLDVERWSLLADASAEPRRPLVVGVDQGEDRTVSIGCVWRRPGRRVQVMLAQQDVDHVDIGLSPEAAVVRLTELRKRWGCRVMLGGPALGLERELRDAGVPVETVNGTEFAAGCGHFDDRLRAGGLAHGDQAALNASVAVARWRRAGVAGDRAFQLQDAPGISPVAAVVRALAGLLSRPAGVAEPVAVPAPSETSGLSSMQF